MKIPAYVVTPTDQRSRAMQPGVEKEKFNLRLKASSYKLQAASLSMNTIK
jgi:hypothetical protein